MPLKIPCKAWFSGNAAKGQDIVIWDTRKGVGICWTDVFSFTNKYNLCVVDYHSKLSVINRLMVSVPITLQKQEKIFFSRVWTTQLNSIRHGQKLLSEKFQDVCRCLNIYHVLSSSCSHKKNGQAEVYINFFKRTIKMIWDLSWY